MRTPPTMVAPLPRDPRVMEVAKALTISRREAIGAALEAWAWMMTMQHDGVVPDAVPDSIDGVVDIPGFGQAMLQARLVGVVNDGLVLPAELRQQQRDHGGGPAVAADGVQGDDAKTERRREQNRVSARRYRRKTTVTGSKAKPSIGADWRSLGRVAGHEVRAYVGQYGCYAILIGATVDGTSFKLTTGDKAWSLDTVRLTDALPGLVKKWKENSVRRGFPAPGTPQPTLVPSLDALRDDADRLTMLENLTAQEARHADGADASSRHADASAASAGPSSAPGAAAERKPHEHKGFHAGEPSADRHADALSSMSVSSKSSSSREEEDMGEAGRKAPADQLGVQGTTGEPPGMKEWEQRRAKHRVMMERWAAGLNTTVAAVEHQYRNDPNFLLTRLKAAGIDRNAAAEGVRKAVGRPDAAGGPLAAGHSDLPPADSRNSPGASGESPAMRRQSEDEVDHELTDPAIRQPAGSVA